MNIPTALYFPETAPDHDSLRHLLLFFESIACYRPVENDLPLDTLLTNEGWISEFTPAPLADERDRFLRLIIDVKQNGLQYLEGFLSSLAVQAAKDRDELASWSLASRLRKLTPDAANDRSHEVLWQARFILKLAEIYAEEEREILAGLRAAEAGNIKLLQSLHGSEAEGLSKEDIADDNDDADMIFPDLSVPDRIRLPIPTKRLISFWANFFIRDPAGGTYRTLATAMEEAADEMIDSCTSRVNQEPFLLADLPMPDVSSMSDMNYSSLRAKFRQTNHERLATISVDIKSLASAHDCLDKESKIIVARLQQAAQSCSAIDMNPAGNQHSLALYLLPGVSPGQLINRYVRSSGKEIEEEHHPNTVLAVLRKKKK